MTDPLFGTLGVTPALDRPDLLATPTRTLLEHTGLEALVAAIDPALADTEHLCAHYGVPLDASANAVVVRGTRAGVDSHVVCMVLATDRLDVNGAVRRRLGARKASFAPMDYAVEATGMEYGGINPIGAPADWPIWVDGAVADRGWVCIGSGIRGSKLFVPTATLLGLPNAERVDGLRQG